MQNFDPTAANNTRQNNETNGGGNEASIPMPSLTMWGGTSSLVTPNAPIQQHNHQNSMQMGSSYQMTGNQGGQQEMLAGFHNGVVPASSTNPANSRGSGRGGGRANNSTGEN